MTRFNLYALLLTQSYFSLLQGMPDKLIISGSSQSILNASLTSATMSRSLIALYVTAIIRSGSGKCANKVARKPMIVINVGTGNKGTEIAQTGTASMPSSWSGHAPEDALDRNENTICHNDRGAIHPWFQLDFGSQKTISQIELKNRANCCGDRFRNVGFFVTDTPAVADQLPTGPQCGTYAGPGIIKIKDFDVTYDL